MIQRKHVPLAWLNLIHEPRRLMVAIGGTSFAVLLIFMQLGFRGALFDASLQLPRVLNADLILLNRVKNTKAAKETIPIERLVSARACAGVESVWPFYMYFIRVSWKNPHSGEISPVAVFAFNPRDPVLLLPEVQEHADELLLGRKIMFDRKSKPNYGAPERGTISQLGDYEVEVVGTYEMGTDFVSDGDLIMSDLLYREIVFPPAARANILNQVDLGLVKLAPGADIETVRADLIKRLEDDTSVLTKQEFVEREQQFWQEATPIGYVFGFGVALGFVVGVIICYQILYADVTDHLAEYATLKAMGYRSSYFFAVILEESLIVGVLGFLPGWILSYGLYYFLTLTTGLPLHLGLDRAVLVLGMTVVMCGVSGLLTIRGLLATDPAELFK